MTIEDELRTEIKNLKQQLGDRKAEYYNEAENHVCTRADRDDLLKENKELKEENEKYIKIIEDKTTQKMQYKGYLEKSQEKVDLLETAVSDGAEHTKVVMAGILNTLKEKVEKLAHERNQNGNWIDRRDVLKLIEEIK